MKKTILVVDDSATVRQQLSVFLSGNGFQVESADGGDSALNLCRSKKFDLVITDLNMQGMYGITFIGQLKKLPGYAATPVFVLTTESTRDVMEKGKAAGATAWNVKPFRPDILMKGIQKVLGA